MKLKRSAALLLMVFIIWVLSGSGIAQTIEVLEGSVLPRPPEQFEGKLEPVEKNSTPVFPKTFRASQNAPNIFLVMTDDVGFASTSTFGGSAPTSNLDKLADQGLRYNQFHTTGLCSPTRAALLTGRNHHAVGYGLVPEIASPYPGYTSRIPVTTVSIARVLRDNGFNTAMFGKDHNVPIAERSSSGPFDQWPTGRGFEYFYGFVAGDTDQWHPAIYEGTSPVDDSNRPEGYILDKDLADRAINWIHNQKASAPDKPFFIYYATGSAHAPHQAPKDWIAKFRGKFDHGWDKEREIILARQKKLGLVPADTELSPRPECIPAWESLSIDEKIVFARFMEVYAAMLAHQDAQIGRILDELERMGIADNTLVVFIQGDNGSSGDSGLTGSLNELAGMMMPEGHSINVKWLAQNLDILGGPKTYQGYSIGWAFATNTPFPWMKQISSHLGGVRNGMVISWPDRIKQKGEVRDQYHHIIDVMPTLLEAAGVSMPTVVDGFSQQPIDGKSIVYSFDQPKAASIRQTQYYEILGNRGIYHDGWLANTTPRNMPWQIAKSRGGSDTSTYGWELYDLRSDFAQIHNIAEKHPDKLKDLQALFDAEARKYNVYPIHDTDVKGRAMRMMRYSGVPFKTEYIYWGRNISFQAMAGAPPIYALPFTIDADIDVPEKGEGVILAIGSCFGGWSFYLDDGKPTAYAALSPLDLPGMQSKVEANKPLTPGKHKLVFDFNAEGEGGAMVITVDGRQVADGLITKRPLIIAGPSENFDIGRDTNEPVSRDYQHGGMFNGEIHKVVVKLKKPSAARSTKKTPNQ